MSNIGNEVTQKLRIEIRTKLTEIGSYVDNELPDYIMVMVANQKTKYQMKDDLSLFLGSNTDPFVDWLHEMLKTMQLKISGNLEKDEKTIKKKKADKKGDLDTISPKSENAVKKIKKKNAINLNTQNQSKIIETAPESEMIKSNQENLQSNVDDNKMAKDESTILQSVPQIVNIESELKETKEEVVLELTTADGDELLEEYEEPKIESKNLVMKPNNKQISKPFLATSNEKPVKRTIVSHSSYQRSSTIGAIVENEKRFQDEDDDEEIITKTGVASVIRVTQRKFLPPELQANKLLVSRAMKEAYRSVGGPNLSIKRKLTNEVEYVPTAIKKLETDKTMLEVLDPEDLRHVLKRTKFEKFEENNADLIETEENISNEEQESFEENQENISIDYPNSTGKLPEIIDEETEYDVPEDNALSVKPRFIVTLDGVDKNFGSRVPQSVVIKPLNRKQTLIGDELILDEEVDEDLMEFNDNENEKNCSMDSEQEEDKDDLSYKTEKCKYWPACKNGDKCVYSHPSNSCKAFPNCKFGDKCLYVHPNCKYDSRCTKKDCPYTHASRRKFTTQGFMTSGLCKYFPNCVNPSCSFYHPKPCSYGNRCRNRSCQFTHPTTQFLPSVQINSIPKPHQLKWMSSKVSSNKSQTIPIKE